jgi:hypothetical protein
VHRGVLMIFSVFHKNSLFRLAKKRIDFVYASQRDLLKSGKILAKKMHKFQFPEYHGLFSGFSVFRGFRVSQPENGGNCRFFCKKSRKCQNAKAITKALIFAGALIQNYIALA